MKLSLANKVRSTFVEEIRGFLENRGEDVGQTASNTLNFPYVLDEEECFVEVVVKVVKKDADECYQEREDYKAHLVEQAEKAAEREQAAAEKKAKAEAKKKAKEEQAE